MKARSITSLFLFAALAACTKDADLTLPERTATSLGVNGGTAKSADGALTLSFGPGALTADTQITVETFRDRQARRLESFVYELGPHGHVFAKPVTIEIAATAEPGVELAIANLDGAEPELLGSSTFDRSAGRVRATLEHFSTYAVVQVYNPCENRGCGDACTVCDPLDTNCVEPGASPKACNISDLCVAESLAICETPPDGGIPDEPDATPDPDAGGEDGGGEDDAGQEDTGVPATCTETFAQREQPQVDILIIVDDSASMEEEQVILGNSFPILLDTLVTNAVDFRIGVTTTDMDPTGPQGALIGSPAILTNSTPNLEDAFEAIVKPGTNGSAWEQGLAASMAALETSGPNPTFRRADAALTVIYLSDEVDQSPLSPNDYATFLLGFRTPNSTVQANVIVGDEPIGCTGPNGIADVGMGYIPTSSITGGVFVSICAPNYDLALTDLGDLGYGYLRQFNVSSTMGNIVGVTAGGVPVPSASWSHDQVNNTLTFEANAAPEPGAEIIVEYDGC